jgi:hypothetical protein
VFDVSFDGKTVPPSRAGPIKLLNWLEPIVEALDRARADKVGSLEYIKCSIYICTENDRPFP